jgi:F-type H+-transporting ATPase subunit epsilon
MAEPKTTISYEILSLIGVFKSGEAKLLTLPGSEGQFGVMPGHSLFLTSLKPGLIFVEGSAEPIFINGGIAYTNSSSCTILANDACYLKDLKHDDLNEKLTRLKYLQNQSGEDMQLMGLITAQLKVLEEQKVA